MNVTTSAPWYLRGCPLGCQVAINAKHKQQVERRARELIDDYETGGRSCAYDCSDQGPVACLVDRCGFQPLATEIDPNR